MTTDKKKWTREQVLSEARARTHEIRDMSTQFTQDALSNVLKEAGWTADEFLTAFIDDIRKKDAASPTLPPPKFGPGPAKSPSRPPRKASGTLSRVEVPPLRAARGRK